MHIGLTTSVIQRGRSGVGQHVLALTRALLDAPGGHELTLFVLAEDRALFAFAEDRARIVPVGEEFRPAARDILWHQTRLPQLARELRLDVIHTPSYRRLIGFAPCAKVGTIHDLAPFRLQGKYDWKRMFYGRVVVRQLARLQHAIIAVSDNTARDIQGYFGVHPDTIRVIHNGLDHTRFCPQDGASERVAQAWNLDRAYFLYISRLEHPGKNHVRLIEAFECFKTQTGSDSILALGGSDWHGAQVIHQRAAASPVSRDIRFLGFVSDAALPDLYRGAQAMVYPSLFEGFGMPPIEAMACGCPVISSTRGALGEIVGSAARIVDPENPGSMAEALAEIASDAAVCQSRRNAGLARARQFDWASAARQTLEVYELAVRRSRRGPIVPTNSLH